MRNAHAGIPDRLTAHNRRYASEWADVLRLRSLLALGGVELDLLVLIQRPVAGARDRGEVDEHVRRPVIGGDETKALVGVEPLHGSCCHQFKSSVRHATTRPRRADRELTGPAQKMSGCRIHLAVVRWCRELWLSPGRGVLSGEAGEGTGRTSGDLSQVAGDWCPFAAGHHAVEFEER